MNWIEQLFSNAQQWVFERAIEPVMFAAGLGNLLEDGYDAAGWLIAGLAQLVVMVGLIGPLQRWRPVEAVTDRRAIRIDILYTLLHRLVRKRALAFQRQGRLYEFRPLVAEDDCEHAAASSFLSRFFNGELAPLLARFVEREQLTPGQVERLKRILDGEEP